jgi:hypothetical protein
MHIIEMIVMPVNSQLADIDTLKPIIMTLDNKLIYTRVLNVATNLVVVASNSCLNYFLILLVEYNLVIVPRYNQTLGDSIW